jgi:hypothetical protein
VTCLRLQICSRSPLDILDILSIGRCSGILRTLSIPGTPTPRSTFPWTSPPDSIEFANTMKQADLRLLVKNHDPRISVGVEITPMDTPQQNVFSILPKNIMDEKLSCI